MCAGCHSMPSWASVLVGAAAAPIFLLVKLGLSRAHLDDALDAVAIHGSGGVWGALTVHFFRKEGILATGSSDAFTGLLWNLLGMAIIFIWSGLIAFVVLFCFMRLGMLRARQSHDIKGWSPRLG